MDMADDPAPEPHDMDEPVKIDLPFEEAVRALLATPPPPENGNGGRRAAEPSKPRRK